MKTLRYRFWTLLLILNCFYSLKSQVLVGFTQRTAANTPNKKIYSIRGDYTMIGNTNLSVSPYGVNTNNSNNTSVFVDVDGDPNTFNSSSATLSFSTENGAEPTCSNILYAGLYWTGRCSNGTSSPETFSVTKGGVTKQFNKRTVSLKGPGQSNYTQFTANAGNIYYPTTTDGFMYSAYIEVTDYVKTNGLGEYFLADMALVEGNGGSTGYYGGWGMIVIYENSKMDWRDVTVFDGHAYVRGNTTVNYELPVTGFNTAQSGQVNLKLGLMAGEGDVGITGDYFKIRNYQDNAWVTLNHSGNSTNNFFNSSVQTGGNARNPNLQNNTGLDIAMFDIPNVGNSVITNNQTSTKFQYGSTQDTYVIFCIAMSVDAYVPDVAFLVSTETINGVPVGDSTLTVHPGEDISYKLQIKNQGTEDIDSTKFVVPIPYTATFVDGSISTALNFTPTPTPNNYYYDSTYGATGAVIWDIGTLPLVPGYPDSVLAELTFHLKVIEDCNILKNPNCPPLVTLAGGAISGRGATSGIGFHDRPFIQGYQQTGLCTGEPITDPIKITIDADNYIAANCQNTPDERQFVFCNYTAPTIPIDSISSYFPLGLRYYNTNKVTASSIEYDENNPFPATYGSTTYFAIPDSAGLCYYNFSIVVSNITSTPATSDVAYCLNATPVKLTATVSDTSYRLYYFTSLNSSNALDSIVPSTNLAGATTYYVAEGVEGECISPNKDSIIVSVYDIQASINVSSQVNILCKGDNTGSVKVDVTGGTGSYSYSWNTIPVQTTATATGLSAGDYTVTVTDNNGCNVPVTATVTITEPSQGLSVSINPATLQPVLCKGASTGSAEALATGGSGSYSYLWNTTPSQIGATAINLPAGNYTVTVTDNNGCTVPATATVIITEPPQVLGVSVNLSTLQPVLCKGASTGSSEALATGGSGSYSYLWNTIPVQTTATATGLSAGNYTVTVTDNNGCNVPATAVATITEPPQVLGVSINLSTLQPVLCKGASTGSSEALATGGSGSYSYSWNTSPVQTTATATGLSAGDYTVTVTDNNGCNVPVTAVATIIEPPQVLGVSINLSTLQPVLCKGASTGSAEALSTGGSGSYSYLWNTTPSQIGATAINLPAGNYTVTVTDNNGCLVPATATVTITEPPQVLGVSVNLSTLQPVLCKGASTGSSEAQATGGSGSYSYSWNTIPVQTTAIAIGLSAGNYTVTVTDNNGCNIPATAVATITEPPQVLGVSINLSTLQPVLCKGASTGSSEAQATGGSGSYSYSWNTSPVQTTATATGLTAGNYTVTVTDNNGCNVPATAVATISGPPQVLGVSINLSTLQPVLCKGASTGSAEALATGGSGSYSYLWNTTPSQIGATAINLPAGNYTVTVTDNNGCTVPATATVTIIEPAQPLGLSINSGTQINVLCKGASTGSAEALATGGSGSYSYSWNTIPVQTTATATGLSAGNYTVTVTDNNGCNVPVTAVATITEPQQPLNAVVNTASQINVSCNGGNNASVSVIASGGSGSYLYSWSTIPVQTTFAASGLTAGVYTVTVADANGCGVTASDVVLIKEPNILQLSTTTQYSICDKSTGVINLTVNGGMSPYSYVWSNGSTEQDITNLNAGDYSVIVTDNNGCTASISSTITQTYLTLALNSPNYYGGYNLSGYNTGDGSIDMTINGVASSYNIKWSNGSATEDLNNLPAGVYSVIVEDSEGCAATAKITLTQPLDFEMPTGISPDGDGKNDYFVIHGSEISQSNKLTVFNRWGNIVYETTNYKNDWGGRSLNSEQLPDGTYFVIFEILDKNIVLKGYVDIRN